MINLRIAKKSLVILGLLAFSFVGAGVEAREEVPLFIDSPVSIEYIENDNNNINYNSLDKRKENALKQAQENQNPSKRVKLDTREINHDRALNFTTRQNNATTVPIF